MFDDNDMSQETREELNFRRELRHKYHMKKLEIQEQRELITADASKLTKQLEEVEELFANVRNTREAALDSGIIRTVSSIGAQKAKELNVQLKTFQPFEFVEKAVTFMKGGQRTPNIVSSDGWDLLGCEVIQLFVKPPTFHFINGSFEREEIVHKERKIQKREKEAPTKTVTPVEVPLTGAATKTCDQTTEEVERVLGILHEWYNKNEKEPICYFEFITNPDSFGLTVENIFHVAFLVKDGHARISLDEDQLPVIEPIKPVDEDGAAIDENEQFIMSITMDEWQTCRECSRRNSAIKGRLFFTSESVLFRFSELGDNNKIRGNIIIPVIG